MKRLIIFVFIYFIILTGCSDRKEKEKKPATPSPEVMLVSGELKSKNYKKVIEFVNDYFDEYEIDKSNVELIDYKLKAIKEYIKLLQKKINKKNMKRLIKEAKSLGIKYRKGKFYYDYIDYYRIWQAFPSEKKYISLFWKYYKNIKSRKQKKNLLMEFIKKVNIEKEKEKAINKITEIYEDEYINNKISLEELLDFYSEIKPFSTDKNRIQFIIEIGKYILKNDINKLKNKLTENLEREDITGYISKFMYTEFLIKNQEFERAYKLLKELKRDLKGYNKKEEISPVICIAYMWKDNTIDTFKEEVKKRYEITRNIINFREKLIKNKKGVITGKRIRIRKTPKVSKKNIITSLNYGDIVIIKGRSKEREKVNGETDYWYKVELKDGTVGWVFGKYISIFCIK